MEITNAVLRIPLFSAPQFPADGLGIATSSSRSCCGQRGGWKRLVVKAKGKKGMLPRQYQQQQTPQMPKIEDDGNPKFVIFIRDASVNFWYPVTLMTGGTTAKIMVAAKDTFVGKYLYKDTLNRNLAAVIFRDEKEIQRAAGKQFKEVRLAKEFRYGYKLLDQANMKASFTPKNVIELPTKEEMRTVVDKVKDFFGDAKESFGKITSLPSDIPSSNENPK